MTNPCHECPNKWVADHNANCMDDCKKFKAYIEVRYAEMHKLQEQDKSENMPPVRGHGII